MSPEFWAVLKISSLTVLATQEFSQSLCHLDASNFGFLMLCFPAIFVFYYSVPSIGFLFSL